MHPCIDGLKKFTESALHRKRNVRRRHNTKVRDFADYNALSHSTASASHWSKNLGGPSHRTIRRKCTKRMHISPFLDRNVLEIHMLLCLLNAAKNLNMDVARIFYVRVKVGERSEPAPPAHEKIGGAQRRM